MSFFNKKEEVMEIVLTQFGKDLLAKGSFSPVYYQFFDDDILYNTACANFEEHQNDSEPRITENTPRLRSQHLTKGVQSRFLLETESINQLGQSAFTPVSTLASPTTQDRILLYPLAEQGVATQKAPAINIISRGQAFEDGVKFLELTGSGIRKNIPQITVKPKHLLMEDRSSTIPAQMINDESFIDLTSDEITFADNSKIKLSRSNLVLDVEELNVFFGKDNFELEIYEVVEVDGKEDVITRMTDMEKINKYFHIKTDSSVTSVPAQTSKELNHHRRSE